MKDRAAGVGAGGLGFPGVGSWGTAPAREDKSFGVRKPGCSGLYVSVKKPFEMVLITGG